MGRKYQSKPNHTAINVLFIGLLVLLIIFGAVTYLFSNTPTTQSIQRAQPLAGSLAPTTNGVQEVALSMQGFQYQPNPIRVKIGVPVRMTADLSSVRGCMRSIVIPELGVSGRVYEGNNVITFTPTKAGTFRMTCSMGMADGTLIVEDENGQAPAPTQQAVPLRGGGSCGSGGCGCGGQ